VTTRAIFQDETSQLACLSYHLRHLCRHSQPLKASSHEPQLLEHQGPLLKETEESWEKNKKTKTKKSPTILSKHVNQQQPLPGHRNDCKNLMGQQADSKGTALCLEKPKSDTRQQQNKDNKEPTSVFVTARLYFNEVWRSRDLGNIRYSMPKYLASSMTLSTLRKARKKCLSEKQEKTKSQEEEVPHVARLVQLLCPAKV